MKRLGQLYIDSFSGLSKEIWLLSLVTLINRSGAVVMLFLTIYLTEQLGFSKGQAGLAAGCVGLGAIPGAYLGGWLTDKIGYFKVMSWSLFLVGFCYFGLTYLDTFYSFCIGVFLTTLVGDTFRPASSVAISAYSEDETLSRSLSLYRLAINLGFALGGGLAGIIAGTFGYDWLFIIDGITCIIAAFALLLLLNAPKVEATETEENEAPLVSAYKDTWYLSFVFMLSLNVIVFLQLFNPYPVFCREVLKMSEELIGAQMTFNGLLICLIEMPLILVLTQRKLEIPAIIWGVVLIGLSYVVFNIFGFVAWVAVLCMILISVGEIINFPLAHTIAMQRSTPRNKGQYMALFSMMFSGSVIIAPWLGLKIVEIYGYTHLWWAMGLLSTISTIGLIFLFKGYRSK